MKGSGTTSHRNTILTTTVPCYNFPIPISTWPAVNRTWSLSSEEPKCEDIIVTMIKFCLWGEFERRRFWEKALLSLSLVFACFREFDKRKVQTPPQVGFQNLAPLHWSVLNYLELPRVPVMPSTVLSTLKKEITDRWEALTSSV